MMMMMMMLRVFWPFGYTARLQLIRLITMKLRAKCAAIKPRTCQGQPIINKIKTQIQRQITHREKEMGRGKGS